ncbi:spermidine synthase [Permianibacter aggregans]|uniref:Spermidine synthase n=1 Tax=Permianibacter aggregans TaxID=1510150 RepID=A0A4R6UKF7_9GAMM|nr:fused MFS/spermidine synthase [Permianibacter aggregans]QGX38477.1 hypothetical protein E2H98_01860 [Permianibacter aggregans]TDQ45595.1 spermidine synthase [Permianibacter aggregans]
MKSIHLGCLLLTLLCVASIVQAKVIHEERSLYRNILIDEKANVRCMRFVVHNRGGTHNQSCKDLNEPRRLVFDYAQKVMMGLLLKPEPKSILIVGLGGGSLPMAFHELLPNAVITSVEIDPAVTRAAKAYFDYQENDFVRTETADARVFIKRAMFRKQQWDWIILDAFNGDYIPEHLMTMEFFQEVKSVLAPGGLVTANTFSTSRLYDHESTTYQASFKNLLILKSSKGNRVIFAAEQPLIFPIQESYLAQWQQRLQPYDVNIKRLLNDQAVPDWDTQARVLTDQYAPANILKHAQ